MTKLPKGMLSPHFSHAEAACSCCGKIGPYPENLQRTLTHLEKLRALAARPVIIKPNHCLYRCPAHNAAVGGVPDSLHTLALAADLHIEGYTVDEMADLAERAGFMGIGKYDGWIHADLGPWARW